jgi:hypothetical protein
LKWEAIVIEAGAAKPPKREFHSLSFLSDDALLLVGGWDGGSRLKDVWTYRISTNEWKQHEDLPAESLWGEKSWRGLYHHKAVSIMNTDGTRSVYVTGGTTGGSPYHPKYMFEFKLLC